MIRLCILVENVRILEQIETEDFHKCYTEFSKKSIQNILGFKAVQE